MHHSAERLPVVRRRNLSRQGRTVGAVDQSDRSCQLITEVAVLPNTVAARQTGLQCCTIYDGTEQTAVMVAWSRGFRDHMHVVALTPDTNASVLYVCGGSSMCTCVCVCVCTCVRACERASVCLAPNEAVL